MNTLCCYLSLAPHRLFGIPSTNLLVPNSKLALRFFILLAIIIQLFDCIIVQNLLRESNITLCVLMSRVDLRVIWQPSQHHVQRFIHLRSVAFEEASAASDEQCVACKDCAVGSVLEEIANRVLCVARRVKRSDFYRAEGEDG